MTHRFIYTILLAALVGTAFVPGAQAADKITTLHWDVGLPLGDMEDYIDDPWRGRWLRAHIEPVERAGEITIRFGIAAVGATWIAASRGALTSAEHWLMRRLRVRSCE